MHSVAFLGLGAMGLPMALNLQRKGFAVTAWNRTPGKGDALVAAGGRLAPTPRAAVEGARFVVTMLADPAAVREVAAGPEGFLAACAPGTVWVDCSTIGPAAVRELAALAAGHGVELVDAPVLGSVGPATQGTLTFLVGGSEGAVTAVRPLLQAMGQAIHHLGPVGAGAAAKLVSNLLTGTLVAAFGEALALAEALGLDRAQMCDFLMNGPCSSPILQLKAPAVKAGDFAPLFRLRWMEKDLNLALQEALKAGAALPATAGAHAAYAAARAAGLGDQDYSAVAAFLRRMAAGPAGNG